MQLAVPQRSVSLIEDTAQFQPSNAGGAFYHELAKVSDNISKEMQSNAEVQYTTQFLTDARKSARSTYEQFANDPAKLEKQLTENKNQLISAMPQALRPKLDMNYDSLSEDYINKSRIAKNKRDSIEVRKTLEQHEIETTRDILNAADNLFADNKNLTPDEVKAKQLTASNVFATGNEDLISNWSQTDASGNPILSEEQIFAKDKKLKQAIFSRAANSYLDSHSNKLKAYDDWVNNRVTIDLPEGSINIRDAMSPDVKEKVDADLRKAFKDDLFIKKQYLDERKKAAEGFASKQTVENALNGYITLDPTSKDSQKAVDKYWGEKQSQLLNQGKNYQEVLDQSLGLVAKTGVMPSAIKSVLTANITNGNVDQRATFSKYIADAAETNPKVVNDLSDGTKATAFAIAKNLRAGLSKEQSVAWAMNDMNEAKKEDNKFRESKFEDFYKKSKVSESIVSNLQDEQGFDFFKANPQVPDALINEHQRLAKGYFVNEKIDAETANHLAEKTIKSQWGITEIGGKRYMKFAPEVIYGNRDGWIQKQLEADYQAPAKDLSLEVDYSTTNTNKPSYFVMKKNDFGGVDVVLDENNRPKKFTPDFQKSRQAQIESDLTQGKVDRNRKMIDQKIRELAPLGR